MTYNQHAINDCLTSDRDARSEQFRRAVVEHGEPFAEPRNPTVAPLSIPHPEQWLADFYGWTHDNRRLWSGRGYSMRDDWAANNTIHLIREWIEFRLRPRFPRGANWWDRTLERAEFEAVRDAMWGRLTPVAITGVVEAVRAVAQAWAALHADVHEDNYCWRMREFLCGNLPAIEAILKPVLEVE